jgi:hypothetical protein
MEETALMINPPQRRTRFRFLTPLFGLQNNPRPARFNPSNRE